MNGLWAGYTQIWNKYLPDLFVKWLRHEAPCTLHVSKKWVERDRTVMKSLFQTQDFFFFYL